MIRIPTRLGDKRVKTLQHGSKWFTVSNLSQSPYMVADTLYEAGQNHLQACLDLQEKLKRNGQEV